MYQKPIFYATNNLYYKLIKKFPIFIDRDLNSKMIHNFQNDTESMFENPQHSDIKIIVDNKEFKLHKIFLSRNKKLCQTFASDPNLNEIFLSDLISDSVEHDIKYLFNNDLDQNEDNFFQFSSKSCETFLRFLYDPTKIKAENVTLDLILVSHKYSEDVLKEFCENHLFEHVNIRNVVRTLLVSLKTDCEKLKKQACLLVARHFCEMKFNEDFKLVLENDKVLSAILDCFGN